MAEIPVKKEGGIPGWVWLLGLIALGLLAWMLLAGDDEDVVADAEYNDDRVIERTVADNDAAVRTMDRDRDMDMDDNARLTTFTGDFDGMYGRTMDFDNVRVTSVTGDMSFYVAPQGSTRDLFVVFDEQREGRFDIDNGEVISFQGKLMRADEDLPSGVFATVPNDVDGYIMATEIERVSS